MLATVLVLPWATWRARFVSLTAHLVSVGILTGPTCSYAYPHNGVRCNDLFLVYGSALGVAGLARLDGRWRLYVASAATADMVIEAPR